MGRARIVMTALMLGSFAAAWCGEATTAAAPGAKAGEMQGQGGGSLPKGVHPVRTLEGIQEFRLDNGLQVLLYPDATKPTTTVNITYKVGSRMENYGETGMAHLLEHLMFKGSKRFPDPDKEFSARGFHNNGTTSYDRTNYFSTFAATDDNLHWALAREADAMVNSFIARKDLDSEMTVVRNEYEMGENRPESVLGKRLYSAMFNWHSYGKETIGNRSDIENVAITNLQAFYRLYYQPDNAVLILAGKFDVRKALGWIAQDFGPIPRPRRSLPPQWTVEPDQDGERQVIVRRKGNTQLIMVGYHIPAERSRDTAALSLAAEVLADTPNGRLHHELVESGLASDVFVEDMTLFDPGMMVFGARVKPGDDIGKAKDRLIEVVESGLSSTPVSAAELERVKKDAETSFERLLDDPQEFGVALSDSISQGDWRLFFVDRDQAQKVSAEQVGAAAAAYFRRDNRTVGLFIPEDHPQRSQIPANISVDEMLKDYQPRQALGSGESFEPTQENIDARTMRGAFGELKYALLPKVTRGGTVNVATSFEFGTLESLRGKVFVRDMTTALIERGSQGLTRQQIADEKTRLKITGDLLDFQTTREHLAEALKLSARVLKTAQFPEAEFDQLKREWLTSLQGKASDPTEMSRDALQRAFDIYPAGDPRHYLSLDEKIAAVQAVSLNEVRAFYQDFWGTARGQVAVVGDFDAQAVKALLPELFADWLPKAPYEPVLRDVPSVPVTHAYVDTPDKENAVYRARIAFSLRDDDPDAPALVLANEILGGGSGLHSRLVDRVRQKDGLSYGIGSGLSMNARDRAASWSIGAISAPQNVNHVARDVDEELTRALRDGVSAEELEQARSGLLQGRMMSRSDDGTLAAAWVSNLDLGRTFSFSRHFEDAIRAVTVANVNDVIRRYLDPAHLSTVIAGDAAKGAKREP